VIRQQSPEMDDNNKLATEEEEEEQTHTHTHTHVK